MSDLAPLPMMTVLDQTPRHSMSIDAVMSAMADDENTTGELIIGVKEPMAVRGVSTSGVALPRAAAELAERTIRLEFPEVDISSGVVRTVTVRTPRGIEEYETYSTAVVARLPAERALLMRLQAHPMVDYLEPNFTNGVTRGSSDVAAVRVATDVIPWGVDTVRLSTLWQRNLNGWELDLGHVDTGIDIDPTRSPSTHPDLGSWTFTNEVSDLPGACQDPNTACYYEERFHGTGVAGLGIGRLNGSHAAGGAPWGMVQSVKVAYTDANGTFRLPQDRFVRGVEDITLLASVGNPIKAAVTSVGYEVSDTLLYPYLRDAFARAYNANQTLWFTATSNDNPCVCAPGHWGSVVAVGALNKSLARGAWYAGQGAQMELMAPGQSIELSWNRNQYSNGWTTKTGASFAAPLAAATAILTAQAFPHWDAWTIRAEMTAHARKLPGMNGQSWTSQYGFGMVDAVRVVDQIQ